MVFISIIYVNYTKFRDLNRIFNVECYIKMLYYEFYIMNVILILY